MIMSDEVTKSPSVPPSWGLALSGGGSRAAAFHRGTVRGLIDVGLLSSVSTLSTVSGGSVFGAAWMAHRADGHEDQVFLDWMGKELEKGFIARALRAAHFGLLRLLLPGYSRTTVLAEFFQRELCRGKTLSDLPERPRLCINTAVLENGQVGKLTADGFSTYGTPREATASRSIPLGLAAAASAAFPIGLPPITLDVKKYFPDVELAGDLAGLRSLHLTDGGVLENLGFQTLWKSERFATRDFIVSDAGVREEVWQPSAPSDIVKSLLAALLSLRHLTRVITVIHDKQNRWAREMLHEQVERSLLEQALGESSIEQPSPSWLEAIGASRRPRRRLLLVRVNQTLTNVLARVPAWRLIELRGTSAAGDRPAPPDDVNSRADAVREYLAAIGVDLSEVDRLYRVFGGDAAVRRVNGVSTTFNALTRQVVDALEAHAYWQVRLMHLLYGAEPPRRESSDLPAGADPGSASFEAIRASERTGATS